MKRIFSGVYATLIFAVSFFTLAACSSDDTNEGGTTNKDFPTFTDISVAPGDTGSIEFTAYNTWTISSDKPTWFKLDANTGKAGAQKVTYTVTDDGITFDDDVATITFGMDGKTVTFKATRSSKEREIKVYSRMENAETGAMEYNEITSADMIYYANAATYQVNFAVVANFDWKLTVPAWASINQDDMSGDANPGAGEDPKTLSYKWIQVDFSKAGAEDMTGEIVFTDRSGKGEPISLAITSPGSKNYMMHTATESVTLNNKGKYVGSSVGGGTTTADSYDFTITAGNEGVKFFRIAKSFDGWYGLPGDASTGWQPIFVADWCTIATTPATIGPNVKKYTCKLNAPANSGDPRFAALLAIPTSLAGSLTEEDLVNTDGDAILEEYQKYIVLELTQEGKVGLAYMYSKPEYLPGIDLGESNQSVVAELPEEFRSLLSYSMTYNSVDRYSRQSSQVKVSGWNFKSDDSHINVTFIVDGQVTTTPPTWFSGETSGMGPTSYMAFGFSETPAWTAARSAWVLVQEYEFVGEEDKFVTNIMTIKVTQNANNYDDEE